MTGVSKWTARHDPSRASSSPLQGLSSKELSEKNPRKLVDHLKTLMRANLNQAIEYGRLCAEAHPKNPYILCTLAVCLMEARRQGDLEEAARLLDSAIQNNPKNAPALTLKGNLAHTLNNIEDAKRWYLRALDVSPNDHVALRKLGEVALQQSELKAARKYFEASLRQSEDGKAKTLYRLGTTLFRLKEYAEARVRLEELLELEPNHQAAQNLLRRVNASVMPGRRARSLRKMTNLDECNPLASVQLAQRELLSGRFNEAKLLLCAALEKHPGDERILALLGQVNVELREYKEAVDHFREALRKNPNSTCARLSWAQLALRMGYLAHQKSDVESAIRYLQAAQKQLDKVLKGNPSSEFAGVALGWLVYQRGEAGEARKRFLEVYKASPRCILALTSLAAWALLQHDPARAAEWCERAQRIDADNPDALLCRSILDIEAEQPESARGHLGRILACHTSVSAQRLLQILDGPTRNVCPYDEIRETLVTSFIRSMFCYRVPLDP